MQKRLLTVRNELPRLTLGLWFAIIPICAVVVAVLALIGTDQGSEIVESLSVSTNATKALAFMGYLFFVLSLSLAAGLAVEKLDPKNSVSIAYIPWWVFFVAMASGVLVLRAHILSVEPGLWILFGTLIGVPALMVFVKMQPFPTASQLFGSEGTRLVVAVCTAVGLVILGLTLALPVVFPRLLGPIGIIYFGFGFWTLLATLFLVIIPSSLGWPTLVIPAAAYVLIAAHTNDNHQLRVCQYFEYDDVTRPYGMKPIPPVPKCSGGLSVKGGPPTTLARSEDFEAHVKAWLRNEQVASLIPGNPDSAR